MESLSNVEFKEVTGRYGCNCCSYDEGRDRKVYDMSLGYRNQKMTITICSVHLGELLGKIIAETTK